MSFDVSPLAGSPYAARPWIARAAPSARRRRSPTPSARRPPPIPAEVWDQVDAAARLADNLHSEGRAVRFDVHKLDGGVVASLVDDDERHAAPAAARGRRRRAAVSRTKWARSSRMAGIQIGGIASGTGHGVDHHAADVDRVCAAHPHRAPAGDRAGAPGRAAPDDSKLTNLKLAAGDLRSAAIWTPTQAVSSGNERPHARQLAGAAPGGYTVNVSSLASADSRTYAYERRQPDHRLQDGRQRAEQDLRPAGKCSTMPCPPSTATTLARVGVNVGGKLSLARRETGDHANWGFDASGPAVGAPTSSRDGANASYTSPATRPSHLARRTPTDGLPGLQPTLQGDRHRDRQRPTPPPSPTAVKTKLKAFVSAYNASVILVRSKLTEKRVHQPAERRRRQAGGALRRRHARQRAVDDAPGDPSARRPRRSRRLGGLPTGSGTSPDAWLGSRPSTSRASTPRGPRARPPSRPSSAPDAPRLCAGLRGGARPDHARRRRPSSISVSTTPIREISYIKDSLASMDLRLQTKEELLRKQFTAMEQAHRRLAARRPSSLAGQLAQLSSNR